MSISPRVPQNRAVDKPKSRFFGLGTRQPRCRRILSLLLMPRRQAWQICPCLVVALPRWISACLLAQSRPKNNPAKRAGKFEWREIQMGTRLAGRSHSLIGNSLIEERGHVMITARNCSCWRRHHEVPDGACVAPMFTPARITRCMYFP